MGPFVVVKHPDGQRAAVHYSAIIGVEEDEPCPGERGPVCIVVIRAGNTVRDLAAWATLDEVLALVEKARAYDLGTLIMPGDVLP